MCPQPSTPNSLFIVGTGEADDHVLGLSALLV
jgi:hypothetical protein